MNGVRCPDANLLSEPWIRSSRPMIHSYNQIVHSWQNEAKLINIFKGILGCGGAPHKLLLVSHGLAMARLR